MKFSIEDSSVNMILQKTADLVKFTEEILNGNLHFLHRGNGDIAETFTESRFKIKYYALPGSLG